MKPAELAMVLHALTVFRAKAGHDWLRLCSDQVRHSGFLNAQGAVLSEPSPRSLICGALKALALVLAHSYLLPAFL